MGDTSDSLTIICGEFALEESQELLVESEGWTMVAIRQGTLVSLVEYIELLKREARD